MPGLWQACMVKRVVTIERLYTSPGHNFYGHHGEAAGTHETAEQQGVELVAGKGIVGDRFFGWKEDYKGQVTLFDAAVVDAVRDFAGRPGLSCAAFRRNVIVRGVDLNELIGKTFRLAGLRLSGVEECKPCYWMDEACGTSGTEEFLKGRGGLRCRILDGGELVPGACELEVIE